MHNRVAFSLIVFLLMLSSSVIAQPQLYIWAGGDFNSGSWNDVIVTNIDSNFDIPIYMACETDVWVGDLCFPLGIQLAYLDQFDMVLSQAYPPFDSWDVADFTGPNDDTGTPYATPPGWQSLSMIGFCELESPYNSNWFHSTTPQLCFTVRVHSVNDEGLIGQTISDAIGSGVDQILNTSCAGDTLGITDLVIEEQFASIHFALPGYPYLPGDVNMYVGVWGPSGPPRQSSDVTYMVNFFKSIEGIEPCYMYNANYSGAAPEPGYFWASADFNGNCQIQSSDVVRLVSLFRGQIPPEDVVRWCGWDQPDPENYFMPLWPTPEDTPVDPPTEWSDLPNGICQELPVSSTSKVIPQGR